MAVKTYKKESDSKIMMVFTAIFEKGYPQFLRNDGMVSFGSLSQKLGIPWDTPSLSLQ